jgi:predicted DNA-binding antitoxin AbrB/MazE fold protein
METIRATFRNGVLAPEKPLQLPEGSQVTLWVGLPGEEIPHLREQDREFLDRLTTERAEVFRRLAQ